ncbi:MAG: hypothetical protein AB7Q81_04315 [Gammaproteobacteria bacterium]
MARLRAALGVEPDDAALSALYETWLMRDVWRLADEALPLLVGVDPDNWANALGAGSATWANALMTQLASAPGIAGEEAVAPAGLRAWARERGTALPACAEQLLDFIASVVPGVRDESAAPAAVARAAEREILLGAALALVTRFPAQCRDEHGFFDGGLIADQILAKAALWFPLEPPRAGRDEIATLLESYLA